MFLLLLLISLSTWYAYFRITRRHLYRAVESLPAPFDIPIIGACWKIIGRDPQKIFDEIFQNMNNYKGPVKFWAGSKLFLVIDSPEDIQIILNSPYCQSKSYVYKFFDVGNGLATSPAEIWKPHRKLLNEAFSPSILKSFLPIFNEKSSNFVKYLKKFEGKESFDFLQQVVKYTTDSSFAATIGIDMQDVGEEFFNKFINSAMRLTELAFFRIIKFYLHWDFLYKIHPIGREAKAKFDFCHQMAHRVLQKKREKRSRPRNSKNTDGEFKQPQIFLDKLLEIKELDDQTILDHVDTMVFAGLETTALALANIILALAMHPKIQERVYQEVVEVIPEIDQFIDSEMCSKLTYIEMVIKEALRLFHIGSAFGRYSEKDVEMENYVIPKGSEIIIFAMKLHRSKDIWGPDADKFDPDNFLPERVAKRHPYSYIPFIAGPRNCIGKKFSIFSMKILLSNLLKKYRFSTHLTMKDYRVKAAITTKIIGGHFVQIFRR